MADKQGSKKDVFEQGTPPHTSEPTGHHQPPLNPELTGGVILRHQAREGPPDEGSAGPKDQRESKVSPKEACKSPWTLKVGRNSGKLD